MHTLRSALLQVGATALLAIGRGATAAATGDDTQLKAQVSPHIRLTADVPWFVAGSAGAHAPPPKQTCCRCTAEQPSLRP